MGRDKFICPFCDMEDISNEGKSTSLSSGHSDMDLRVLRVVGGLRRMRYFDRTNHFPDYGSDGGYKHAPIRDISNHILQINRVISPTISLEAESEHSDEMFKRSPKRKISPQRANDQREARPINALPRVHLLHEEFNDILPFLQLQFDDFFMRYPQEEQKIMFELWCKVTSKSLQIPLNVSRTGKVEFLDNQEQLLESFQRNSNQVSSSKSPASPSNSTSPTKQMGEHKHKTCVYRQDDLRRLPMIRTFCSIHCKLVYSLTVKEEIRQYGTDIQNDPCTIECWVRASREWLKTNRLEERKQITRYGVPVPYEFPRPSRLSAIWLPTSINDSRENQKPPFTDIMKCSFCYERIESLDRLYSSAEFDSE